MLRGVVGYIVIASSILPAKVGTIPVMRVEATIPLPDSFGGVTGPTCAVVNPATGKLYVGGSQGDRLLVVDTRTHKRCGSIRTWSSTAAICINGNSNKVYCASSDSCSITVVDARTSRVIREIRLPGRPHDLCSDPITGKVFCTVTAVSSFRHDDSGRVVIIDGAGDSVRSVVDVDKGAGMMCVDPRRSRVYCANASTGTLSIVDGRSERLVNTFAIGPFFKEPLYDSATDCVYCAFPSGVAISPRGIAVVDCRSGSVIDTLRPGRSGCSVSAAAGQDRVFISGEKGGTTRINGRRVRVFRTIPTGGSMVWDRLSDRAYVMGMRMPTVIDCAADSVVARVPQYPTSGVVTLCYSAKTREIYCVTGNGISVVDCVSMRVSHTIPTAFAISALCYNAARQEVFCISPVTNEILVVDAKSNRLARSIASRRTPRGVAWNGAQQKVYVAGVDNVGAELTVIDGRTDSVSAVLPLVHGYFESMYWVPDVSRLYCFTYGEMAVFDGATDRKLAGLHVGLPFAFNAEDKRAYGVSDGGAVLAVDALSDTVVATLPSVLTPGSMCHSPAADILYGDYSTGPDRDSVMQVDVKASRIADSLIGIRTSGVDIDYLPPRRRSLWYDPVGRRVLAYDARDVTSVDVTGEQHRDLQWGGITALEYVPDAKLAFVISSWLYGKANVMMMDLVRDSLLCAVRVGGAPVSMAWYPDSSRLFVGDQDGSSISVVRVDLPVRE
jgi:DNA-binding beta-propeller fold protein YncE